MQKMKMESIQEAIPKNDNKMVVGDLQQVWKRVQFGI